MLLKFFIGSIIFSVRFVFGAFTLIQEILEHKTKISIWNKSNENDFGSLLEMRKLHS
jgi:hypothetical protein